MKKVISAVVMAGALSQMANAMGPVGDTTHRHFYKDQEWIWQTQVDKPKEDANKEVRVQGGPAEIWHLPVAFLVPHKPTLAFLVPHKPTVAFLVPHKPTVAFLVPHKPTVAFLVPHKPTGV